MVAGLVLPHMCLASPRMPHALVTSGRMASTCASACPPLLRSLALTLTHGSVRSDASSAGCCCLSSTSSGARSKHHSSACLLLLLLLLLLMLLLGVRCGTQLLGATRQGFCRDTPAACRRAPDIYRICKERERERERAVHTALHTYTRPRCALHTLRVLVRYYCVTALLLYCRWWRGACSRACRRLSATRSRPKKQKKRWARGA
jgi:hypothetical protein